MQSNAKNYQTMMTRAEPENLADKKTVC